MNIQEGYDATSFVGPINKKMNYLEGNNKSNKTATLWTTPVNPIKHGGALVPAECSFLCCKRTRGNFERILAITIFAKKIFENI